MLLIAQRAPDRYAAAMQEDRVVEWWSALLFLAAGVAQGARAVRGRRLFDALVGLFCLFVAAEEVSWGQRLLGFTPPAPFLAHNTQQEFNLHNFADVFGKPKWMLALLLLAYGLLLPAVARTGWGQKLVRRAGATPPPLMLTPWFLVCVALLVWYPVAFTGEWVECLAGFLFLASAGLALVPFAGIVAAALAASLTLAAFSTRGGADDPARVACARAEVNALLSDVMAEGAAADDLLRGGTIHKRVWTAAEDDYLALDRASSFQSASCAGPAGSDAPARRRYAVDPWGTAYWIKTLGTGVVERRVVVYSFGPNRRRDGEASETGPERKDDIVAAHVLGTSGR